jgi:hypothetical protein
MSGGGPTACRSASLRPQGAAVAYLDLTVLMEQEASQDWPSYTLSQGLTTIAPAGQPAGRWRGPAMYPPAPPVNPRAVECLQEPSTTFNPSRVAERSARYPGTSGNGPGGRPCLPPFRDAPPWP